MKEYTFSPSRKWRFDRAFLDAGLKVAFEIEGGVWQGQGHANPYRFEQDCEKYNIAQCYRTVIIRPPHTVDGPKAAAQVDLVWKWRQNGETVRRLHKEFVVTERQLCRLVAQLNFAPTVDVQALRWGEFIITYEA